MGVKNTDNSRTEEANSQIISQFLQILFGILFTILLKPRCYQYDISGAPLCQFIEQFYR